MEAKLLVLCALVAYTAAGPVRMMTDRSDTCARSCKPSTKFTYHPGQTYMYDYTISTKTSMDGASQEQASLSISGQADIEVIDQCEFVLMLRDVRIFESKPYEGGLRPSPRSRELTQLLEAVPLRFSFQDGVVEELCPEHSEDPWALNMKRGLLSALQNSMHNLEGKETVNEVDVTGRCDTSYEVTSASYWGVKHIKRSKDLLGCTDRHGYSGSLQSTRYNMPSELQAVPLMTSKHECQQDVNKGLVQSSTCTEKHLFRPFSSEGSGAVTTVSQNLKFKAQKTSSPSRRGWIQSRAEMTFDHGYGVKNSREARMRTVELLNKLCGMTMNGVQLETPRVFSQLVGAVQKLARSDIRDIYQKLLGSQICSMNNHRAKEFFLDALPMAGSSETVDMMKELMLRGDVTGMEADLWITSLAFITEPTPEMLESAQALMQSDALKTRAMLAVSSMVNNRCKKTECSGPAVSNILRSLEEIIGSRCYINNNNIEAVMTALRAVGNTGLPGAADIINRCLKYHLPLEVRVAAAQAFRRVPCDVDRRSYLSSIMQDTSEDSEMRIAAYLQLMTCPNPSILNEIQIVLEKETEESQVGSFIWSHLTNLKETSSPHKQGIKDMVKDVELKKMYDLNPLKFSRNFEKSAFLRAINSGIQGESNVIFSQSSVPRSMTANLTFDLFGHSMNVLEIGGRLEGVEYLMEYMQSFFLADGRADKKKLDELKASGFARIFGNELSYSRLQGVRHLTSGKTFNILDFLIKLSKDHNYSFTKSLQFLDSSITVPTAIGLPLTLSVNGTAVVDIKATGKMDLRKVSHTPRSVFVEGEIRPSGSINVDGVMSVDALVSRSGLKVSSSMHSRLAMKGRLELDRGKVLSLQVDTPEDRMDILDVRSKFFILHNKAESEQKMISENRKEFEVCSGSTMAKITGLEMCGQLQFPNASMMSSGPYFPMTGPSSISLVLHKRDSHTGYRLMAKRMENKRSSIAQLSFNTPGSSVVRAMSFDMSINYPKKEAEIAFASPWKKAQLKGSVMNDPGMKSLTGSLIIDDDQVYSVISEVKVDDKDKMTALTPLVEIRRPGVEKITLLGNVMVEPRYKSARGEFTVNGAMKQPIQAQASYVNNQKQKSVSGSVTYGKDTWTGEAGVDYSIRSNKNLQAQFKPVVRVTSPRGDVLRLEGAANYRQDKMISSDLSLTAPGLMSKPASMKFDLAKIIRKKGPKYNMNIRLKSKPFTGTAIGFINMADAVSSKMIVKYNVYRGARERITITGKLSNKSTPAFKKYTLSSSVNFDKHPQWNVKTTVDFDHKKKRTEGEVQVTLGKNPRDKSKQILLSAIINRKIKDLTDMDISYKMKAVAPMLKIDTSLSGDHSHTPDSVSSKMSLNYAKDAAVKAGINWKNKSGSQLKMNGDASLSFPGHSYEIDSSLKESRKLYVHTVSVKTHKGALLAATSTWKYSKDNTHDVTSDIRVDGSQPIKMSGTAALDLSDLHLQGEVLHGRDSYSFNTLSKISRGPRGKWIVELNYPSRSVAIIASGGLKKNSASMDVEVAWDKGRDDSAKVTASAEGAHKTSPITSSSTARVDISTPFRHIESLSASASYDEDSKRLGLDGKVSLGKGNTYYTSFSAAKPFSVRKAQLTWTASSPMRGMKKLFAFLDHQADQGFLNTVIKASKGPSEMQLSVQGQDRSDNRGNRNMNGGVVFRSDIPGLQDIRLNATHKDDGRRYKTSGSILRNRDSYSADLEMSHRRYDWQVQNSGTLRLTSPEHDSTTSWQHRNSEDDIQSGFTTKWDRNTLKVELSGDKQQQNQELKVNGALSIKSPWRLVRDFMLTVDHQHSDRQCKHKITLVHNGEKKASAGLNYQLQPNEVSGDFAVSAPSVIQDKSGKLRARLHNGHTELQIAPGKTFAADWSYSKSGENVDAIVRVTTPSGRNLMFSGSAKKEREDLLIKTIMDLGLRQIYDGELRMRPDTLDLGRVKVNSPITTLDAGYQFSGGLNEFEASADLLESHLQGKYSGSLKWELDEELSGKLRIDMPYRELRYIQLVANSKESHEGRRSRLEVEYFPRKMYALTSFYSNIYNPMVFTLDAESPIPGYENFGLSIRHEHSDTSINTHGELQYLPEHVIDSTLTVSWDSNIEGSLVVRTPFSGFRESKLSVRHDGSPDDFTSHGEMTFMEHTAEADARLVLGYSNQHGSFSIESSLPSMDKIEAKFNTRGVSSNFKGSASVAYGDEKGEIMAQHKYNPNRGIIKSSVMIRTPFTRVMKSSVDISSSGDTNQATLKGQYGLNRVDSVSELRVASPDISASSDLTYDLGYDQPKEMKATFSKKGEWDDVELTSSLVTPYTEDASMIVKHAMSYPIYLRKSLEGSYGHRYSIMSDTTVEYRGNEFRASSSDVFVWNGIRREFSSSFSKSGDIDDMTFSGNAKADDKEVRVNGDFSKQSSGINAKVQVFTPLTGFERVGAELSHSVKPYGFNQRASVTYMTDHTIEHTLNTEKDGYRRVLLDASLTSPFRYLESTAVHLKHETDQSSKTCSGKAEITSTLGRHVLLYKRRGDWNHMTVQASLDGNGEKLEGNIDRVPLSNGYKHAISLKGLGEELRGNLELQKTDETITGKASVSASRANSISLEGDASIVGFKAELNGKFDVTAQSSRNTAIISMKKSGPLDDLSMEIEGAINSKKTSASAHFKKAAGGVSGDLKINTPMPGFRDIGGSFQHSGSSADRFNSQANVVYTDGQEISGKVHFFRYQLSRIEATAELSTPFVGLRFTKATYRHAGSSESFTCTSSLEYGDSDKISTDLRAIMYPKYDMSLTVKTPFRSFRKMTADAKLESLGNTHSSSASVSLGDKEVAVSGTLDMESVPMTVSGKLSTPLEQLSNIAISGSHQGTLNDFSSSFVFNSPQTDEMKGDAMFKAKSVFDMSGSVSLNSDLSGLEDLRAEVKTSEMGYNGVSAHTMIKWAPERQMTMDGHYDIKDYSYQKEVMAELMLSTPFELLRSTHARVNHERKGDTYIPKVDLAVNGKTVLDADAEVTVDSEMIVKDAAFTSRKPWPTQLTSSLNLVNEEKESEIFLNWNRDSNDQNVRVQTKVKDNHDPHQRDMDYSIKVILPSRTVSSGVTLKKQDKEFSSGGYMAWDDRASKKVFYSVALSDKSQYYRQMYTGNVRFGIPTRTLAGAGMYSNNQQTSAVDASFQWDADRDSTKKVGVSAKLVDGTKTKADVTLELPAIGKTLHIDHEMELNQGRTVWDGKTELSYSNDFRRKLTLASSLKDISGSYSSGKNYSLAVAISHPHTETDVSFTSFIGADQGRYSAAMDTVYLTSRRQRQYLTLRGEIDQLRRQIDLQLVSPLKKMSMRGEVESTEPYAIKLTNTFDDDENIQSTLNIDPERRSLRFATNYDLDNPAKKLVLEAKYVNASAIRAELYHEQYSRKITDALLAIRLNTSTLIHSRMAWRPQAYSDVENFIREKSLRYSDEMAKTLESSSGAIGQEVSDKYTAYTEEIYSELSPVLNLVRDEMTRLSQQVERFRRKLHRMYRLNEFHLMDIGDSSYNFIRGLKEYNDAFIDGYSSILSDMYSQLDGMKNFNIRERYDEFIVEITGNFIGGMERSVEWLSQLDDQLQAAMDSTQEWVTNHPGVQMARQRAELLGHGYSFLMSYGKRNFNVPERYTSTIYGARDTIAGSFKDAVDKMRIKKAKDIANKVYQQGAWAYNYWQVEKNAKKHADNIINALKKHLEQRFEEIVQKLNLMKRVRVTVFDPEEGELQMEISTVPVELKSLQELPDLSSFLDRANEVVDSYVPDKATVLHYYNQYVPHNYVPWQNNQSTPVKGDLMSQLERYKPGPRVNRRRYRPIARRM